MIKFSLLTKLKLAWNVLSAPTFHPVMELQDGLKLDLTNRQIIIPGDLELRAEGNLRLSAGKHLILESSRTPEERDGYLHSIWLNPDLDDQGRPVKDETPLLEDKHDEK